MKNKITPGLLILLTLFCSGSTEFDDSVPMPLRELLSKHGVGSQVVLVESSGSGKVSAVLFAFEKKGLWKRVLKVPVVLGRNGFAVPGAKKEGDGKTPSGVYTLAEAFGYPARVQTKLNYIPSRPDDYWVDDVSSKNYNRRVKGKPKGGAEKMLRNDHLYKYGVVVNYNTAPVISGKGSAIFLHIWRRPGAPTAGCIAMQEKKYAESFELA